MSCSPGCTLTGAEVVEMLAARGIFVVGVVFVEKRADGAITWEGLDRLGATVSTGIVTMKTVVSAGLINVYAEIEVEE
ncbi:MAG: hypothetical protein ACHREM_06445 [Polyangiales bacterium]